MPVEEIKARVGPLAARKATLATELAGLAGAESVASLDAVSIKRTLLDKVKDVRAVLSGPETSR